MARAYDITVEGDGASLSLAWRKDAAKAAYMRHSEGAYLLRTNLTGESEQELWHMYMQLNDAEAAFRTLKQDLSIRPVYHQLQQRVEETSGVSLDEEATDMIRFQHAYQAAARVITTMDEMLNTLINQTGQVGR